MARVYIRLARYAAKAEEYLEGTHAWASAAQWLSRAQKRDPEREVAVDEAMKLLDEASSWMAAAARASSLRFSCGAGRDQGGGSTPSCSKRAVFAKPQGARRNERRKDRSRTRLMTLARCPGTRGVSFPRRRRRGLGPHVSAVAAFSSGSPSK